MSWSEEEASGWLELPAVSAFSIKGASWESSEETLTLLGRAGHIINLRYEGFRLWCGWRWGASAKTDGLKYMAMRLPRCPLHIYNYLLSYWSLSQASQAPTTRCLNSGCAYPRWTFVTPKFFSCVRVVLEHMATTPAFFHAMSLSANGWIV